VKKHLNKLTTTQKQTAVTAVPAATATVFQSRLMRNLAILGALAAVSVYVAAAASSDQPGRPNFVFVMADDLDADYKQDRLALMPNLKHYWADNGLEFVNHVAAQPVCGPSRSSL
jgi:predicted membrane-bound mannosyltransferase